MFCADNGKVQAERSNLLNALLVLSGACLIAAVVAKRLIGRVTKTLGFQSNLNCSFHPTTTYSMCLKLFFRHYTSF